MTLPKFRVEGVREALAGDVPVPERLTLCGLPAALSATASVPPRAPATVGLKVTLAWQLAPAASVAPQLFVWPKSPLVLMLETANGEPPVFVTVTACVGLLEPTVTLLKLRFEGTRDAPAGGAVDVPLPVRLTLCEPPAALSTTVNVPLRVPVAAGVKVTLASQIAPVARVVGQLFVWLKSPPALMLVTVTAAPPTFAIATICGGLGLPNV